MEGGALQENNGPRVASQQIPDARLSGKEKSTSLGDDAGHAKIHDRRVPLVVVQFHYGSVCRWNYRYLAAEANGVASHTTYSTLRNSKIQGADAKGVFRRLRLRPSRAPPPPPTRLGANVACAPCAFRSGLFGGRDKMGSVDAIGGFGWGVRACVHAPLHPFIVALAIARQPTYRPAYQGWVGFTSMAEKPMNVCMMVLCQGY